MSPAELPSQPVAPAALTTPVRERPVGARSVRNLCFEPRAEVRVGLIGTGHRQLGLMKSLAPVEKARVVAITDPSPEATRTMVDRLVELGKEAPAVHDGENGVDELLARDDIDLVMIATPWNTHTPYAVQAMKAGKHVGIEVPAAVTLEDCWDLVDTSETTQRHCVILENCCYGRQELFALNLVRSGALGTLLHAECSYTHDLRAMLMNDQAWRRRSHIDHDGNLYPTHGLGPVASYFDINRGDRFTRIVSMGSPSAGLQEYRAKHVPEGDPRWDEEYQAADINTSLIQTEQGRSIVLQHQVIGPRPYDRRNQVVGTNGIFTDYPPRIFLEEDPVLGRINGGAGAREMGHEEYSEVEPYLDTWEHSLWGKDNEDARAAGGHGGMDYLMLHRLVQTMVNGEVPEMDVYDAAAWSAPAALSELSVNNGNVPVEFPDFTRGDWQESRIGIH